MNKEKKSISEYFYKRYPTLPANGREPFSSKEAVFEIGRLDDSDNRLIVSAPDLINSIFQLIPCVINIIPASNYSSHGLRNVLHTFFIFFLFEVFDSVHRITQC